MNDSIPRVTRWLDMVKIARKSFKVLSKGEGASDGLVAEEPS
jgi:FMN-dependent NADH-azoreductase